MSLPTGFSGHVQTTVIASLAAFFMAIPVTQAADKKAEQKPETKSTETKKAGKMTTVIMETSMGTIEIELNGEKAPISTENFLAYTKAGFYDGTVFHRIIPTFMIQGGGMTEKMEQKKTNAPIANESGNGLKNDRGTIAMARTSDPKSATAQFFINVVNNGFLNKEQAQDGHGYAVFGKVTAGMDVVDKIKAVPTGAQDVPKTAVVIKSVKVK